MPILRLISQVSTKQQNKQTKKAYAANISLRVLSPGCSAWLPSVWALGSPLSCLVLFQAILLCFLNTRLGWCNSVSPLTLCIYDMWVKCGDRLESDSTCRPTSEEPLSNITRYPEGCGQGTWRRQSWGAQGARGHREQQAVKDWMSRPPAPPNVYRLKSQHTVRLCLEQGGH